MITIGSGYMIKPVFEYPYTIEVSVVTSTDRPKSVRNRCVIEVFDGALCCHVASGFFCGCGGFCLRTESDLFLFLLLNGLLNH